MQIATRDHIPKLLNDLNLRGFGSEIGIQQGKFSSILLDNSNLEKLYLIDAWRQFEGPITEVNPNHNTHLEFMVDTFKAAYRHSDRAVIIRELSVEASYLFPDGHFDFIYIDAAHDVENVRKDLETWFPKMKPGGIFAGHDYYDGFVRWERGKREDYTENKVKTVVDTFFEIKKLKVFGTTQDIFPSWLVQV